MSWDVFVQDLPQEAKSAADIPADFRPASIGKRSAIIEKIREVFPTADFSDPSWGRINGDNWSIEVNIGANEDCGGFALHFAEGTLPLGLVRQSSNAYTYVRSIHRQATSSKQALNLSTAFANGVLIVINSSRAGVRVECRGFSTDVSRRLRSEASRSPEPRYL